MKRIAPTQESPVCNSSGLYPLSKSATTPELDIILASERDIAFCIRLAQRRLHRNRPCLIQICSENIHWQQAPIFERCTDIVVVSDQAPIDIGRIYFISSRHSLDFQQNVLWLKKTNNVKTDFIRHVDDLLCNHRLYVGDLVVLKNALTKYKLDPETPGISNIWRESKTAFFSNERHNVTSLTRSQIASHICRDKEQQNQVNQALIKDFPDELAEAVEESLLNYLQEFSKIAYQQFRQSWLVRLITQRYAVLGYTNIQDYIKHIKNFPNEWQQLDKLVLAPIARPYLFNNVLNCVEALMRSKAMFSLLDANPGLRVWNPGCGQGEVAYALSIAWHLSTTQKFLKIFATDLSSECVETANNGINKSSLLQSDYQEPIAAFFEDETEEGFGVPNLRKDIIFSVHDLANSPNFNLIHLIICRDTLSKYKVPVRRNILSAFNRSLVSGGIIWLDKQDSEDAISYGLEPLPDLPGLFLKSKTTTQTITAHTQPTGKNHQRTFYAPPLGTLLGHHKRRNRYSEYHGALDVLIDKHMPPGILFDKEGKLIHVLGNVSEYLEPIHQGSFSTYLQKILKPSIAPPLRPAIDLFLKEGKDQVLTIPWSSGEEYLSVELNYLHATDSDDIFGAVFFKLDTSFSSPQEQDESRMDAHLHYIEQLEKDLQHLQAEQKEPDQALTEELENMRSLVSDLVEANEQMQEIQEDLLARHQSLSQAYQHCRQSLNYAIDSGANHIATAIIDRKMRLLYCNPNMAELLVVNVVRIGCDFGQFVKHIGGNELNQAIRSCFEDQSNISLKLPGLLATQLQLLVDDELLLTIEVPKIKPQPLEKPTDTHVPAKTIS